MRTHLLLPEDPEVMELSDQGVGAAGCWREKSATDRNEKGLVPVLKCWVTGDMVFLFKLQDTALADRSISCSVRVGRKQDQGMFIPDNRR